MEDLFAKARVESIRGKNYIGKNSRNEARKKFIEEYISSNGVLTENLRKTARMYVLLKEHVVIDSTDEDWCPKPITKELIDNIYSEIKENAKENFIYFFESYKRKIDLQYSSEGIIQSSFEDLKTAFITYRKCTIPSWDCPPEMINEGEMKNLYLLVSNTKLDGNQEIIR